MARRRYISTQISLDAAVDKLAQEYGDFAALLYTWMIPYAEDDATITGDPDELMFTAIPRRRDKTIEDVVAALEGMEKVGLIRWDRENKIIYFPPESFYRYQSYIREDKRRKESPSEQRRQTAPNSDDYRQVAQNAVSPSPTPSPSPSPSPKENQNTSSPVGEGLRDIAPAENCQEQGAQQRESVKTAPGKKPAPTTGKAAGKGEDYSAQFEEFWKLYPRKVEKQRAFRCWKTRLREGANPVDLIEASKNYARHCQVNGTDMRYIKHPATFLGPDKPFEEWIKPNGNLTGNFKPPPVKRTLEHYRESFKDW